jgi:hypothetical protein
MTRVLFATLFLTIAAAHAEPHYTEQMFRRGLHEPGVLVTTAPLFVLITLRDPDSGAERAAAIPGPFLLGAIETEYRLKLRKTTSHDDIYKALAEQQQKEVQIALAQPNRVFVFRSRKARNNVQPRYTPAISRLPAWRARRGSVRPHAQEPERDYCRRACERELAAPNL